MKQYNNSIKLSYKNTFDLYLREAIVHLQKNDRRLAKVIGLVGYYNLKPQNNQFESIIDAVISQQLSMFAAQAIFNRFVNYFKPKEFPTPEDILATSDDDLRKLGVSKAKIICIKDLCQKIKDGIIDLEKFNQLDDDEIIKELTRVKGIGRWTAHMFLIFSLGRLNILPTEDLGIRKGIQKLYRLKKLPDHKKILEIATKNNWSPYCSIASWYIWRSLELN